MHRVLLVVWGVLWLLLLLVGGSVLLMPDLISIGLIFLILPGLIAGVAPTLLLYTTLATALAAPWWRWMKSAAIVPGMLGAVLLGIGLPVALHRATTPEMQAWMADDQLVPPADRPASVALVERLARRHQPGESVACSSLCLRLLYNGAVERVLMGTPVAADGDLASQPFTAWWIERQTACPAVDLQELPAWSGESGQPGELLAARVGARIAAGECLRSAPAARAEAAWLLVDRELVGPRRTAISDPWALFDPHAFVRRMELVGADGQLLFRQTGVEWLPLRVPLFIDPMELGQLKMAVGWGRRSVSWQDYADAPEDVYRALFGAAVRLPEDLAAGDVRSLVAAALDEAGDQPAGLALVPRWLDELQRGGGLGDEDLSVLSRALRDPRLRDWGRLSGVVRGAGASGAGLAPAILDRLESGALPHDADTLRYLAGAFDQLPEGVAAPLAPRLRALAADPARGPVVAAALQRIADGGAAQPLIELQAQLWQGEGHAVGQAALVGLCRLGPLAGPAESAMWERLQEAQRARGNVNREVELLADILASFGRSERLLAEVRDTPIEATVRRRVERVRRYPRERC